MKASSSVVDQSVSARPFVSRLDVDGTISARGLAIDSQAPVLRVLIFSF